MVARVGIAPDRGRRGTLMYHGDRDGLKRLLSYFAKSSELDHQLQGVVGTLYSPSESGSYLFTRGELLIPFRESTSSIVVVDGGQLHLIPAGELSNECRRPNSMFDCFGCEHLVSSPRDCTIKVDLFLRRWRDIVPSTLVTKDDVVGFQRAYYSFEPAKVEELAKECNLEYVNTGNWHMLPNGGDSLSDAGLAAVAEQRRDMGRKAALTKQTKKSFCPQCVWNYDGSPCDRYSVKYCRSNNPMFVSKDDMEELLLNFGKTLDLSVVAKKATILCHGGAEFKVGRKTMIIQYPSTTLNKEIMVNTDWLHPPSYDACRNNPARSVEHERSTVPMTYEGALAAMSKAGRYIQEIGTGRFSDEAGLREAAGLEIGLRYLSCAATRDLPKLRHAHYGFNGCMDVSCWTAGHSRWNRTVSHWDSPRGWRGSPEMRSKWASWAQAGKVIL